MAKNTESRFDNEPQPFGVGKELHAHLSGSIIASAICDIIYKNDLHIKHKERINSITEPFGTKLADDITNNPDSAKEQFTPFYSCPPNGRNRFEEVMQRFNLTSYLLQLPGIKSQFGEAVCEDFKANGVNYVEWRVDPFSSTKHETAEEGFEKLSEYYAGMKKVKLDSRFLLSISRSRYQNGGVIDQEKIKFLEKQIEKLLSSRKELPIIGFDVSGSEVIPISSFQTVFDSVKDYGLAIVPHVGEGTNSTLEESLGDVETALDIGSKRLGHAIVTYMPLDRYLGKRDQLGELYDTLRIKRLKEKQKEVRGRIKQAGVAIEVCPTSNLSAHLGLLSYKDHPIDKLINSGIPFVVCSDDPGIFGTTLREEITVLAQAKNLDIQQVIASAATHSIV